jgi:hypothetical protein
MKHRTEFRLASLTAEEWLQLVQALLQAQQSSGVEGVVVDLEAWGLTGAGQDAGSAGALDTHPAAGTAADAGQAAMPGSWQHLCSCSQVTLRRRECSVVLCKMKQLSSLLEYEGWSILCCKSVRRAGR